MNIMCRSCRGTARQIESTSSDGLLLYECATCGDRRLIPQEVMDDFIERERELDKMVAEKFLRIPAVQKYMVKKAMEKLGLKYG